MNKRQLGNTDIYLSELGFGCSALWAKNILPGKAAISEEQAYAIFIAALDAGINFFDTGINYGFAEERLGRCIDRVLTGGGLCYHIIRRKT